MSTITVGILPYSQVYSNDRLFDLSSALNRDNSLLLWHELRETGRSFGWEVHTFDHPRDEFDVYLIMDPDPEKLAMVGTPQLQKSIAQFFEPPDVLPRLYRRRNLEACAQACSAVICFNRDLCSEYGFIHRPWYVDLYPQREARLLPMAERQGICMIAANKFSRHPASRLHERLNLANELARRDEFSEHFYLYGRYWLSAISAARRYVPSVLAGKLGILDKILNRIERRLPANAHLKKVCKGVVASKRNVLARARYNIIMENMYWNGYVTEKLFDALQVGCIPIYFGADDVDDYVPSSIFINGRSFADPLDAVRNALSMTERQAAEMVDAGQEWLRSDGFEAKFGRQSYIHAIKGMVDAILDAT
ncbi:MAG: hypothetical protein J7M14_04115 [Planctomycetes bacterium]|nr:hypothetical protein [Planctomycetota bacterium]